MNNNKGGEKNYPVELSKFFMSLFLAGVLILLALFFLSDIQSPVWLMVVFIFSTLLFMANGLVKFVDWIYK